MQKLQQLLQKNNQKIAEERDVLLKQKEEYLKLSEDLKKYINFFYFIRSLEEAKKERERQAQEMQKLQKENQQKSVDVCYIID